MLDVAEANDQEHMKEILLNSTVQNLAVGEQPHAQPKTTEGVERPTAGEQKAQDSTASQDDQSPTATEQQSQDSSTTDGQDGQQSSTHVHTPTRTQVSYWTSSTTTVEHYFTIHRHYTVQNFCYT